MSARVRLQPVGNLGNQALQLMWAISLKRRLPTLEFGGVDLPAWNLRIDLAASLSANPLRLIGQYVDTELLQKLISFGMLREFEFAALGFRMRNYLPRYEYLELFPRRDVDLPRLSPTTLLINVRGAEILADAHADYGPLPISFYTQLVARTGLEPVFMGQIGTDPYSSELREAFPTAVFLPSRGPTFDFELMRSAEHLVASVSTFSWLAAWLSDAKSIHLPVCGMFNPDQRADIDLLPVDDPRYRFYQFPIRHWTGASEQYRDLLNKSLDFPELSVADIRQRLARAQHRIAALALRYQLRLLWRVGLRRALGIGGRVSFT
jgi:hypothetical protein